MNNFKGVNDSAKQWEIKNNKLTFLLDKSPSESLIAVRTDDENPMCIRFKARANNGSVRSPAKIGISMLDHRADDTGIQVVALLNDRRPHDITCIVNEEIAVYVDGVCTGRSVALQTDWLDEDIDYPVAFAASSAVSISGIETASIDKFITVVAKSDEDKKP